MAQHDSPASDSRTGERVGGCFVLQDLCGSGSYGAVYRATRDGGGAAAVKIAHPNIAASPRLRRRFESEVAAMSRLCHPGVVDIVASGVTDDDTPFFAMEWIDGDTLSERVRRAGPLAFDEALDVTRQVTSALSAAHDARVIHRDLKPSNVMIERESPHRVVLLDFGVAKLLDANTGASLGYTTRGELLGSMVAMAPEQLQGGSVDPRTDVYALGVLIHFALTGEYPFHGSVADLRQMHLSDPPPAASELAPVPADVDDVIRTCMAKRPADRHATAGDVLSALTACRDAGAAASRSTSRIEQGFGVLARVRATGPVSSAVDDELPDVDDALLDAIDACLDRSRAVLEAAGLEVVVELGTGYIAVTRLPREPAPRDRRTRVLEGAVRQAAAEAQASSADGLELTFVMETGSLKVELTANGPRYVGGALLSPEHWSAPEAASDTATQ